ncbi:MAG: hypothetical protein U1E36_07010 [Rickettsiales bacterium]
MAKRIGKNPLKDTSILVIDSDAGIASLMKDVLTKIGFGKVMTAFDGFEGVNKIKEQHVDFIITDWELRPRPDKLDLIPKNSVITTRYGDFPPINGASFVKSLRHSPKSPNPFVPVIMMVSQAVSNLIMFARDSGVNEIMLKPIAAEDLCDRIVRIIDMPRPFVTGKEYKGPCRRRKDHGAPKGETDRRKLTIQVIEFDPRLHHV